MQNSEQYRIKTTSRDKFAVVGINKRLVCKKYSKLDIHVVRMEDKATLCKAITEKNDCDLVDSKLVQVPE